MGPRFFNVKIKLFSFVDASTNDFEPRTATIIELFFFFLFSLVFTLTHHDSIVKYLFTNRDD